MSKIKLTTGIIAAFILGLLTAPPTHAASIVHMNSLPGYETNNNFKVSCTTDGTSAQFAYQKNGGSWTNFGPVIDVTTNPGGCVTLVDSSVVNDQTGYNFMVTVDGMASTNTSSTTYDISGPSPVTNYSKNRINDGQYRIFWTTPGDSDFDKVVIYRGTEAGFPADSSHEIARITGSPNLSQNYDDNFAPNGSLTYFYYVRALDHAGNSSSLAGDQATTTTTTTSTASPVPGSGNVVVLPKEQGSGSVLGTETVSPSPEATASAPAYSMPSQAEGALKWVLTHKKISLGVLLALFVLGYAVRYFARRNK